MRDAFVILVHTGWGRAHWDLMLRRGDSLATWQLAADPAVLPAGQSMPARRLADHRLAYLDYEGPVSRNRGCVARAHRGQYRLLEDENTLRAAQSEQAPRQGGGENIFRRQQGQDISWRVEFNGQAMRGLFELTPPPADRPDDDWTLRRV